MLLTLLAITAGLVGGYFRKGQLTNMLTLAPKWLVLLVPALVLYVASAVGIPSYSLNLTLIATFALAVALFRNYEIRGAAIIGLGLASNLLVLVLNGGIPVRAESVERISDGAFNPGTLRAIEQVEGPDTVLAALGDIIPVPLFNTIVSFGDLIALAGLIVLIVNATLRQGQSNLISVDDLFAEFDIEPVPAEPTIDLRDPVDSIDLTEQPEPDVVIIKKSEPSVDFGQF